MYSWFKEWNTIKCAFKGKHRHFNWIYLVYFGLSSFWADIFSLGFDVRQRVEGAMCGHVTQLFWGFSSFTTFTRINDDEKPHPLEGSRLWRGARQCGVYSQTGSVSPNWNKDLISLITQPGPLELWCNEYVMGLFPVKSESSVKCLSHRWTPLVARDYILRMYRGILCTRTKGDGDVCLGKAAAKLSLPEHSPVCSPQCFPSWILLAQK